MVMCEQRLQVGIFICHGIVGSPRKLTLEDHTHILKLRRKSVSDTQNPHGGRRGTTLVEPRALILLLPP